MEHALLQFLHQRLNLLLGELQLVGFGNRFIVGRGGTARDEKQQANRERRCRSGK